MAEKKEAKVLTLEIRVGRSETGSSTRFGAAFLDAKEGESSGFAIEASNLKSVTAAELFDGRDDVAMVGKDSQGEGRFREATVNIGIVAEPTQAGFRHHGDELILEPQDGRVKLA